MAGLLGFTLADLSGAVDSRKRQYANLVRGLLSDPAATVAQLQAQDAEAAQRNRYTQTSGSSVMPEVAQQGQQAMMDAIMNLGGLLGITAYHGSPHMFDKFDLSKIGTGEGAQAYGHGLYFAENKKVAQEYANLRPIADPTDTGFIQARSAWAEGKGNPKKALSYLDKQEAIVNNAKGFLTDGGSSSLADIARARELINNGQMGGNNLYKVDIPDEHVAKMLDWDKPLSQQPDSVRKALADAGLKNADSKLMTGSSAYGMLSSKLRPEGTDNTVRDAAAAAKRLRELGIPGIKYKDSGSRGSDGGTSNFVLFDDALPKIIGRE